MYFRGQIDLNSFGEQLRYFRRRAQDPERGGSLTQERLTHLLYEVSLLVYSFAAISDWERGKSQIPKDHRPTLVGLVATLGKHGGILSLAEANEWLAAGNYRLLDEEDKLTLREAGVSWADLGGGQALMGSYKAPFLAPPRPFQSIVGRDDTLSALKERLFDRESVTISAVRGLPGVGKTTLAQLLAHDPVIQQAFPDGVLWIGLGRSPDVFFCMGLWADALAIDGAELRQMTAVGLRASAIRARLSNRAALLIIDDVWQAKHAGMFRLGGKDCAHLVTTRLPTVANAFGDAHRVVVETLNEKESLLLLHHLAPQVCQNYPKITAQLARESGGLPLTLILIGSYLRQQAISGKPRRLEQALQLLLDPIFRLNVSIPQSGADAHPSLSADDPISLTTIIGVSEAELLDGQTRDAFYALGLFPPKPNSFSELAAITVIDQPIEILDALVDAGLIENKGQGRVQMHQAIADYLAVKEQRSAVTHRFIQHYTKWLGQGQEESAIELEMDNLLRAISFADKNEYTAAYVAMTVDLLSFLEKRSQWELIDQLVPHAATYAQKSGDYAAAVSLLHRLSRSFDVRLDHVQADFYLDMALDLARRYHKTELFVSILSERSLVASSNHENEQARDYLDEALLVAREANYARGVSMTLGYLGRLSHQNGDHDQTPGYLDEAIAIAREHEFQDLLCGLLILRGASASYSETTENAERYYLEALELARTVGRKDQLSAILTNLGEIETNRENNERAIAYLEEALEIVQTSGSAAREAHIRKDLGILSVRRGDVANGRRHFEIALSLTDGDDNDWLAGYIEQNWAELALQTGNVDEAARLAKQVIARLPDESKNRSVVALARFVQAQIAALRGERELAQQLANQSQSSLQAVGHARAKEVSVWLDTLCEQN